MRCPSCATPSLVEGMAKGGVLIDSCKTCKGVWLDRGEVFLFSRKPRQLEELLEREGTGSRPSTRECPRCQIALEEVPFLRADLLVDRCPECEGYWFDPGELHKAVEADRNAFQLQAEDWERLDDGASLGDPVLDGAEPARDDRAHDRVRNLSSGMLPLPNLFIRSAGVLFLLYGILGLILIALAELHLIPAGIAVAIGVGIIVLQFGFGPWLMDLSLRWLYNFSWVTIDQLPAHLRSFVERVAAEQGMKVPWFGLIHDGAPNAFTYGHHPNNMRIVITQGILDLLEPEEVEGVVAHEIGHGKNWDMLLMTVVQLVPLLLYFAYRTALQSGGRDKDNAYRIAVAIGAYVLYIASEYIVLWFSRCREYYADRFAGRVTGNPNALASALVKIGYGLAARGPSRAEEEEADAEDPKGKGKKKRAGTPALDAIGAMGIFDRKSAVAMVATSASVGFDRSGSGTLAPAVSKENLKSAMQWDLWNPWATFYELSSTHPLIAHRLQYLGDQSAAMGQEPYIVFDRRKPESYWDDFAVDVAVMFLPLLLFLAGLSVSVALGGASAFGILPALRGLAPAGALALIGLPVLGLGIGSLLKTMLVYRGDHFAPLAVAGLLHKVKVSNVRPVPARMRGTIIGRGVPGLIWSEDFVMRDSTGILFLDYRQPLRIWEWLFGLFRAGEFAGKSVEVVGWFRRAPLPYLELRSITVDGRTRNSYARHGKYAWAAFLTVVGLGLIIAGLVVK